MQLKNDLDATCINTIRTLSMDAVQAANSGHPGTPMAMAPVAYCLWQQFLRFDPQDPIWPNRDRFVLSAGHASMLLYSLLHLTGVKAVSKDYETLGEPSVPLEAIKRFRQLDSRCPGHPEYRWTSGVETTTGPLGQGRGHQRRHGHRRPVDGRPLQPARVRGPDRLQRLRPVRRRLHDGRHLGRGRVAGRPPAALQPLLDLRQQPHHHRGQHRAGLQRRRGHPLHRLRLERHPRRRRQRPGDAGAGLPHLPATPRDRPTLIIVDSHIAYGAPHKQDTSAAHGEPLGEEEIRLTKRNYGWPEDAKFFVPDGVYDHFRNGIGKRGKELRDAWFSRVPQYRAEVPRAGRRALSHAAPPAARRLGQGHARLPGRRQGPGDAGRFGQGAQRRRRRTVPWLMGGSADLAPSTKTRLTFDGAGDFQADSPAGRNLHFGIREHAMAAILNGMALVKVRAYGSGFFIFSDYARGAMRLSALMELPVIYIFTHDSIGVGEDGPTHQPVEQLAVAAGHPGPDRAAPRGRQRDGGGLEGHHEAAPRAGRSRFSPARRCRRSTAASTLRPREWPRGVRPGRRAGRQAGRPAAGERQRGGAVPGGARAAQGRGNQVAGGEHAVVGTVRRSAAGVPRQRAAAGGDGAGLGGAGLDIRLGQVRRRHADRASACVPSVRRRR